MLVTLSLRIMECAELRMRCSFRARAVIPGKGKISRVHTSESRASSLALSPREGASTGSRPLVASRDCVRLMVALDEDNASLSTLVFLTMTWHSGVFGPTVVALWIDILRAIVPWADNQRHRSGEGMSVPTLLSKYSAEALDVQKQRAMEVHPRLYLWFRFRAGLHAGPPLIFLFGRTSR